MFSLLDKILDRLCALAGALLFSQAPEFFQQYTQRLAGHVAELQRHVDILKQLAKQSGKTLHDYIHKFISNSDPDFSNQGTMMQKMVDRLNDLTLSLQSMQTASVWSRPWEFVTHLQEDIAYGTMVHFKAGLPLTLEGACYAFIGMLVGFGIYSLGKALLTKLGRLFYTRRATPDHS